MELCLALMHATGHSALGYFDVMRSHDLPMLAAAAIVVFAAAPACADDAWLKASSQRLTPLAPCEAGKAAVKTKACTSGELDALAKRAKAALEVALARAEPATRPLLKRDQAWFQEIFDEFDGQDMDDAATGAEDDTLEPGERPVSRQDILSRRVEALGRIAEGLGRSGFGGSWQSTFGTVTMTPAGGGAMKVAIETLTTYGIGSDRRFTCRAEAIVRPGPGGWLEGQMNGVSEDGAELAADKPHPMLRIVRQGETLRVVAGNEADDKGPRVDCSNANQMTGTYFPASRAGAEPGAPKPAVSAPSFDCARPSTVDEEEICADPELAGNDLRLNRAWKALLPRLDAGTAAALKKDQREYVRAQANQYQEFQHPAWNKQSYFVHHPGFARDKLRQLQRERIALLEGFDEKRQGLSGLWLNSTAIIEVKIAGGRLTAKGWKWEQGDWKAGCDYEMTGMSGSGRFVADLGAERTKNPDTLERVGAMLLVNRDDDSLAKVRNSEDGGDPPKCKRSYSSSSATQLFPVRPSPDIDATAGDIR